jgi:seryl-tRNA synthetase
VGKYISFLGDGLVVGDAHFKAAYDTVVNYCEQLSSALLAEPLHPAGVLPMSVMRDGGYLTNFPHHVFAARPHLTEIGQPAEEYALSPAACLCVYQMLRGIQLNEAVCYGFTVPCARYEEGHTADPFRLASYNVHETVFLGDRKGASDFFQRARAALDRLSAVFPGTRVEVAHDSFFGPEASAKEMYQHRVNVKYELQGTLGDRQIALASINSHGKVFGDGFNIRHAGEPAFTACLGVGLERAVLYALEVLGPDLETWPAADWQGA